MELNEVLNLIVSKITMPESHSFVTVEHLQTDSKEELRKATENYNSVFDRIEEGENKDALDEAVGWYLSATIDHYCQLGVKQGMKFILNLLSDG